MADSKAGPKEQPLPPDVMGRDDATEVLRAFVLDGGLSIAFTRAFDEPDMWGMLLVDIARHAARAYAKESAFTEDEALARIIDMFEAELSISQGGLPIGAVLTRDNKIIARGRNNRVQENNVILHGEMSCLRDAGLMSFHDTVMYTTLSPCSMCAGAIGLFKLSLLVIGESVTFPGSKDILTQFGIPYIDLEDERSIDMMRNWRSDPANERLWQGDIGN